jgi:hypothetical protein
LQTNRGASAEGESSVVARPQSSESFTNVDRNHEIEDTLWTTNDSEVDWRALIGERCIPAAGSIAAAADRLSFADAFSLNATLEDLAEDVLRSWGDLNDDPDLGE